MSSADVNNQQVSPQTRPASKMPPPPYAERLQQLLRTKFGSHLLGQMAGVDGVTVVVGAEGFRDFVSRLKSDPELQFDFLASITAVDWLDSREMRFEAVYHFASLPHGFRLRVKVPLPETDPAIESLVPLWVGANFMERECWDMMGVRFIDHPDQRRILMYDEFVGHPLRKDYPVQGKQPRIPLRHPEVRNTSLDMIRPPLVSINKRNRNETAAARNGHNGTH